MFKEKRPTVSFEIFPPKKIYPVDTIYKTIDELAIYKPDFISVTYGAGGSTKDQTLEIASKIKNEYKIETIAHLTCATSSKDKIINTLNELKNHNIENILALRGDIPESYKNSNSWNPEYKFAHELISEIKNNGDFSIGGACYPEGHIESKNRVQDLKYLKQKTDRGLDFLITQLFFDNDLFYRFRENLELLDIKTPVIAGILPVINIKQIKKIQELSGCNLPPKFIKILNKYEHSPKALEEAGIAYAVDQIIDLMSDGVDGIHIYTMNKPHITKKIMKSITTIRSTLNTTI
jgi:methylenetetrahydrofolate reductase (NADPH)